VVRPALLRPLMSLADDTRKPLRVT
jgi:hypothetical protein